MRCGCVVWALLAGVFALASGVVGGEVAPLNIPPGVKFSLVLETNEYFLGENVLLHYRIENTGPVPFKVSVGGDYRGGTRAHRFKISATDAQGKPVADPSPVQWEMGGLSPIAIVTNGASWYEQVWLMRYCRFEEAGTYTVRVFHDLGLDTQDGWNRTKGPLKKDPRELTATIKFQVPTEQQAREIVAAMLKLSNYSGPTWGQKGQSVPDFSVLRHPVYLPALIAAAQNGADEIVKGIDSIYTSEATKALVDLQTRAQEPSLIGRAVLFGNYLAKRLPKRTDEGPKWGSVEGQELQKKLDERMRATWRAEWAPAVIDSALLLLRQINRDAVQLACTELNSLGGKEHVPAMLKTLDYTVTHTTDTYRGDHGYPEPLSVCKMLAGVIEEFAAGNGKDSPALDSPGKELLFARSLKNRTNNVASWEQPTVTLLSSELPFIRAQTLANLPDQLPGQVADLIGKLMEDPDVAVQNQAFLVAQKMNRTEHREIALRVLGTTKDHWLFSAADQLARKYGAGLECAYTWVRRFDEKLDEPGPGEMAFYALQALWEIATGGHISGGFNSRDDHSAYKRRWALFLAQHGPEIKAGRKFTLGDGFLTKDFLPPDMEYYPPTKDK